MGFNSAFKGLTGNEINEVSILFGAPRSVVSWRKRQTGTDATAYAIILKKTNCVMEHMFTWDLDALYAHIRP